MRRLAQSRMMKVNVLHIPKFVMDTLPTGDLLFEIIPEPKSLLIKLLKDNIEEKQMLLDLSKRYLFNKGRHFVVIPSRSSLLVVNSKLRSIMNQIPNEEWGFYEDDNKLFYKKVIIPQKEIQTEEKLF